MIAGGAAGGAPLEATPGQMASPARPGPVVPGWPAAARAAATVALDRPAAWLIALAGFLARGGIVLVALPIVVLPTPTGISNVLAPIITSVALTGPSPELVLLALGLVGAAAAALIVGGLVGVAADASLIGWAARRLEPGPRAPGTAASGPRASGPPAAPASAGADHRGSVPPSRMPGRRLWSMLLARLLAYIPLAVALVIGVGRLGAAVYHELILPDDLVTPLAIRVIREEPWTVVAIVVAWILGETTGGLAERAVRLDGASVPRALARSLWHLVRWPLRSLLTVLGTLVAFAIVLVPTLLAAGTGWELLASRLRAGGIDPAAGLGAVALAAVWIGGLVLVGAVAAWRSVLWTSEALAGRPSG